MPDDSREVALYYPHMLPPLPWAKQALLLYDQISSIVHPNLLEAGDGAVHPGQAAVRADYTWLRREGHWRPTAVTHLSGEEPAYLLDATAALDAFATDPGYRFDGGHFPPPDRLTSLYLGKLSHPIELGLLERRLAKLGRYGGHLMVHEEIAAILLSVTAKYVAAMNRNPAIRTIPGTDDATSHAHAFGGMVGAGDRHTCVTLLLRGLCPVPSATVSFADIVEFRQRHGLELLRLRSEIDRLIDEVRVAADPVDAIHARRRNIELALADVRSAASSGKLRLLGTAMTVSAVAAAGVVLPMGTFELAFRGFGLPAAVAVGSFVSSRPRPRDGSPYTYLVEAQQLNYNSR